MSLKYKRELFHRVKSIKINLCFKQLFSHSANRAFHVNVVDNNLHPTCGKGPELTPMQNKTFAKHIR